MWWKGGKSGPGRAHPPQGLPKRCYNDAICSLPGSPPARAVPTFLVFSRRNTKSFFCGFSMENLNFPWKSWKMRLWHLRNTNLDLLFLVQIEAPRQGAEKCPETPKITNFTQKSPIFGESPLKLVKSAFLHRNNKNTIGTIKIGWKPLEG